MPRFWKRAQNSALASRFRGEAVVDQSTPVESNCTWGGERGLKVVLRAPLTFEASLLLIGELHITAEAGMDGPCITVLGGLVVDGHVSFSDCVNKETRNKGGAIYTKGDLLITAGSTLEFDNCYAWAGGGFSVDGSLHQGGRSLVRLQNCWASYDGGSLNDFNQP